MADNVKWTEKEFINPYHFVSVDTGGGVVSPAEPQEGEALHTGVLYCSLTTKTPLSIPDADDAPERKADAPAEHKTYSFFHYQDGIPVIPGSSLRGVIRSVYETATDSCFATARADDMITARTKDAYKPGLLMREKDGKEEVWKLYRAERYLLAASKDRKIADAEIYSREELYKIGYGAKVSFLPGEKQGGRGGTRHYVREGLRKIVEKKPGEKPAVLPGRRVGYLYIGEPFSRKRYESVFVKKDTEVTTSSEQMKQMVAGLRKTIEVYRDKAVNKNYDAGHSGYEQADRAFRNGVVPVWYRESGEGKSQDAAAKNAPVYLSMACIGRFAYQSNMGSLLGGKAPCTREQLCKACALFGMAAQDYKSGSRIRITDAVPESREHRPALTVNSLPESCLRELASPHPSYLPFYAYGRKGTDATSYDDGLKIRGRKFYWHSEYRENPEETATLRNNTVKLVGKETEETFRFQVYYERITKEQLDELLWTLTLGDNRRDSNLCYKLGHGKPLGLGSVKICVERKQERSFDADGYHMSDEPLGAEIVCPFPESTALKEMLLLMDRSATNGCKVTYPYVKPASGQVDGKGKENDLAAHQWFTKNLPLGKKWRDAKHKLPELFSDLSEEEAAGARSAVDRLALPSLLIEKSGQGSWNGKSGRYADRQSGGNGQGGWHTDRRQNGGWHTDRQSGGDKQNGGYNNRRGGR